MRVKRFVGDSVAEALGKVKKELGSDAVILQTQQIREGGFLGLFGKLRVEITAAVDNELPKQSVTNLKEYATDHRKISSEINYSHYPILQTPLPEKVDEVEPYSQTSQPSETATDSLQDELKKMQGMLAEMSRQMQDLGETKSVWPPALKRWAKLLRQNGLGEGLVNRLLKQVRQNLGDQELEDDTQVRSQLEKSISQICARTATIKPGVKKPKVVALIGPTGVGKTTTIGKLAAGFSIVDKRRVALITTDTFRVAAVEQLKTFGQIIGVPVEVATSPGELSAALLQHADKELIFIDTAGRSPQHQLHMHELKAYLEKAKPHYTILVLSATTQLTDQERILKQFQPLATHLIVTKIDETVSKGSILNLLDKTNLPVTYITIGQNVPEDINAATTDALTRIILEEVNSDV